MKGAEYKKTNELTLGGAQGKDGSSWAGWGCAGGGKWYVCHLGPPDRLDTGATGKDGSKVSGFWMMGPFTERGKTGCGVGREGELGFGPGVKEMPGQPSRDVK